MPSRTPSSNSTRRNLPTSWRPSSPSTSPSVRSTAIPSSPVPRAASGRAGCRSTSAVGTLAAPPGGVPAGVQIIHPAPRLRGQLDVPGDKSISHRALMLALLASGESRIHGAGDGADVRSTAGIVRAFGASAERVDDDGRTVGYRVVSPGVDGIREPSGVLDCGNSGTSLRLFAGILAGLPMTAVLDGDASLRRRPVARIIEPLRAMGATLRALDGDTLPPVTVTGHDRLRPIDWTSPVPSAQEVGDPVRRAA